ncbi:hypothetical protein RMHFA_05685 [Roseomonas mucosa]|nr:hypothetical protein RMHFA_05685 [Roseomonas mucosa]
MRAGSLRFRARKHHCRDMRPDGSCLWALSILCLSSRAETAAQGILTIPEAGRWMHGDPLHRPVAIPKHL